jgi:hypothetical protein
MQAENRDENRGGFGVTGQEKSVYSRGEKNKS